MADSTTNLDIIIAGANAATRVNETLDAASPATLYGRRASTTTGLTWGYYGGSYAGATLANGTVPLTANATNYIVALRTTGAVSVSTSVTNFNDQTNYLRLYQLVTGASTVTSYVDRRQLLGLSAASQGLGTMATQNANAVAITGGAVDGTPVGAVTPATGRFSEATSTGGISALGGLDIAGNGVIGGNLFVGGAQGAGDAAIEFGANRTAAGNAYLDFHSSVGSDFDFRLLKFSGANGLVQIDDVGTGGVAILTNGEIRLQPGAATRLSVGASSATFTVPLALAQYTLATLPSAAAFTGFFIDVVNATGGPKVCRSNGTVWQILNTTTTVS